MKKLKIRKMIIVLLAVIMMITISTKSLATGLEDPTGALNLDVFEDYPTDGEQDDEGTPAPSTPSTSTPTTPSEEEKLPQTGDASDYAIFLLIGLCTIVSIYAYKKVRDYNRI